MADVFVSYKAEDRRRVKPLVEALQADGFSVWWDEQIGGGAAWRHAIETELNAAKCVIVAWSNDYFQHVNTANQFWAAVLAVIAWPLPLFGADIVVR